MKQKSNWRVFWELMTEDWYFIAFFSGWVGLLLSIILAALLAHTPLHSKELLTSYFSLLASGVGISVAVSQRWSSMVRLQSTKHVPVVIVTGKSRADARHTLEVAKNTITKRTGFRQFKQMENHFKVAIEDNLLITEERNLQPDDPDQWQKLLDRIQNGVRHASDQIPGDRVYHVFVFGYGASSLAVALGAVFGTRHKVIVYQISSGDEWQPVLDLSVNIRKVKETLNQGTHKYIQASLPQKFDPETALVLNLASHIPTAYVQNNMQGQGLPAWTMVEVNNTYNGNLQEKDWTPVVQELFSVYNRIHKAGPARIHLFMSIPTALAFGLGVSMGIYNQVVVYAWDNKQTYYPVFGLDKLEATL